MYIIYFGDSNDRRNLKYCFLYNSSQSYIEYRQNQDMNSLSKEKDMYYSWSLQKLTE